MVTALVGTNWYALKKALDSRYESFSKQHGQLAIEKIYLPEASYNQLASSLESVSLFVSTKMVVATDISGNKEVMEKIGQLVEMVDESTELIIVEGSVDKRSSYYKTLKKLGDFHEFGELNEAQAAAWIQEYVKSGHGEISFADANYMVQRIGANQTLLERELAKLLLYEPKITKDAIEQLTDQTPASTIFNLVDSVFSGNIARALKLYDEQRAQRVEPQSIYGMLVWQMHIVAVCSAAGQRNSDEIARDTGLNSYVVSKAQNIARKMGSGKVQDFLKLLRDIEINSKKQTYNLDDALKYAIASLAY